MKESGFVDKEKPAVQVVPIDSLLPDAANVRRRDDETERMLTSSVRQFGAGRSIVLDGKDVVRAGNGTLKAAREAGIEEVLVIEPKPGQLVAVKRADWTPSEATAYAIADNRLSDRSEFDPDALGEQLRSLADEGFDYEPMGFTLNEAESLITADGGSGESEADPGSLTDDADVLREKWGTEPGQLWAIASKTTPGGEHRLLCGDGINADDIARVGDGDIAILDPPFEMPDDRWTPLLKDPSIVFGQARQIRRIPDRLWRFERVILKATGHRSATVQVLHRHAFVAQCGTVKKLPDDGSATLDSVIEGAPPDTDHPYEKPVGVLVEHLTHWTPPGDVVDHFAGSGSSFVAAERAGRLCRGIEREPGYVAAILERLSGMGLAPRLAEPGTPG